MPSTHDGETNDEDDFGRAREVEEQEDTRTMHELQATPPPLRANEVTFTATPIPQHAYAFDESVFDESTTPTTQPSPDQPTGASYTFRCPNCGEVNDTIIKQTKKIIDTLIKFKVPHTQAKYDERREDGFVAFVCPNCSKKLPKKILDDICQYSNYRLS